MLYVLDDFDHGILSPSGRVSNRTRKATERRLRQSVTDAIAACPPKPQPSERERDLHRAAYLRDLAARGMNPRAFVREAAQLEEKWK